MTRSVKTFEVNKKKKADPIPFEVAGKTFEAVGSVSGMDLMELIAASDNGGGAAVNAILTYLKDALGADQYKEFRQHVKDKDIDIKELNEIAGYLIKEHSDRPTESPEKP